MPYAIFTFGNATQDIDQIDEYEQYSNREIRKLIKENVEKNEAKVTVTYANVELDKGRAEDNDDVAIYDPLEGRDE